ncbi:hypothetical protein C8J38_102484 [Rhizobium sp. PP-WC-2G-219]|nr:hypothetical protein C8J38_102484 [Rhizobium sp. PP-WC-2G-219]
MPEQKRVVEGEIVELDNKSFRDMILRNCVLTFSGGRPPLIQNVDFDGCSFRLEGSALNTSEFIASIARGGGEGIFLALSFVGLNPATIESLTKQATSDEVNAGK